MERVCYPNHITFDRSAVDAVMAVVAHESNARGVMDAFGEMIPGVVDVLLGRRPESEASDVSRSHPPFRPGPGQRAMLVHFEDGFTLAQPLPDRMPGGYSKSGKRGTGKGARGKVGVAASCRGKGLLTSE
ncbi:hypothetical protein PAPYR_6455 [Paratrimastix pyriformis]|uniref:Uncharacterized protein n=1 Tax=Paratrimastix pyriformis TaxID=342808 RepID=A0ABQ8UFB6_9EUKA|nr:hypothetical protein PAPYR_6455 [Paratrimastix pyriformis]